MRNYVYHCTQIYTTKATPNLAGELVLSNLRQPPITRTNRQIRQETLPIFYSTFAFSIRLARLPRSRYDGASKNRHTPDYFRNRLMAFLPGPSNGLQASTQPFLSRNVLRAIGPRFLTENGIQSSNLRFLSRLSLTIPTGSTGSHSLKEVSFTMSSSAFTHQQDRQYFGEGSVDTASLDWNNLRHIKAAYIKGIDSCPLCQDGIELLGVDSIRCPRVNKAADEMAALMQFISKQYPHLTQHVLATIDATETLIDDVFYMIQERMPDDEWEW